MDTLYHNLEYAVVVDHCRSVNFGKVLVRGNQIHVCIILSASSTHTKEVRGINSEHSKPWLLSCRGQNICRDCVRIVIVISS